MKREHFITRIRHRIYLLGQLDYMEQRQFYCNKCNFKFEKLNKFWPPFHPETTKWTARPIYARRNGQWTELLYLADCFEGTNCVKQQQFNSTNSISHFFISNTFNTHMKRHHYNTLGRHRIIASSNCIEGANYMKQIQFNWNWCNFIFVELNTFCTCMKRQHFLALGGHRITILVQLLGNCIEGANYTNKSI